MSNYCIHLIWMIVFFMAKERSRYGLINNSNKILDCKESRKILNANFTQRDNFFLLLLILSSYFIDRILLILINFIFL